MTEVGATAGFDPTGSVALGRTRVKVSRMGIGTNPLAGLMERVPYETAVATVEAAWDEGVRFFDMASLYGYGYAERFVGHPRRPVGRAQARGAARERSTNAHHQRRLNRTTAGPTPARLEDRPGSP